MNGEITFKKNFFKNSCCFFLLNALKDRKSIFLQNFKNLLMKNFRDISKNTLYLISEKPNRILYPYMESVLRKSWRECSINFCTLWIYYLGSCIAKFVYTVIMSLLGLQTLDSRCSKKRKAKGTLSLTLLFYWIEKLSVR